MQIAGMMSMSSLADFLRAEQERTSYRRLEEKTGVSRGALENLIKKDNKDLPELESLIKISTAYDIELYRVIEMAGVDLQLPKDVQSQSMRLAATLEHMPVLRSIVERIVTLSEAGIRPVLDMLRSYLKIEDESGLTPEGQTEIDRLLETEEGRKKIDQYLKNRGRTGG